MTVRELDAADLAASWAAAQAGLEAAPAGDDETWVVPGGVFALTAGLVAGADGKSLTVRAHGADALGGCRGACRRGRGRAGPRRCRRAGRGAHRARPGNGRCGGAPGAVDLVLRARGPGRRRRRGRGGDRCRRREPRAAAWSRSWRGTCVATAGEATGVLIGDGLWSLSRLQVGPVGGGLTRGAACADDLDDGHRPEGRPDHRRRG